MSQSVNRVPLRKWNDILDKAIRFISLRPRSEKEILDYLERKIRPKRGSPSKEVELLIRELKQLNLVNDEEFARWWLEQRASFRPKGKRALRMELRQKGVNEDLINRLIEEEVNEKELALVATQKKRQSYRRIPLPAQKKKLYTFLGRRGFSWEVIKEVVSRLRYIGYTSKVE